MNLQKGLRVKVKSTLCAFHVPYYTHRKNFCKSFFSKNRKNFLRKFFDFVHFSLDKRKFLCAVHFSLDKRNFLCAVHFSLDKRNFLCAVHFSLDTIAKLCPSKFGVFPPFHDSTHYYHLSNLPHRMLQALNTFQSLPKYYYLLAIRHYHTFY